MRDGKRRSSRRRVCADAAGRPGGGGVHLQALCAEGAVTTGPAAVGRVRKQLPCLVTADGQWQFNRPTLVCGERLQLQ